MKKLYILLILFTILLFVSCSQKKSENSESSENEKIVVTQEQVLANKLKEYLDENPLFLGFYSNGDGDITEYRLEEDNVYRIQYESRNGEYTEKTKYEVFMNPTRSDPNKWKPVFYNSSDVLYDIYLNINRYDTLELAIMANYKHDYGPGIKMKSVTATSVLGEKYSAENLIDGSWDIGGYRLEHGHEDSGVRPVIIGHEHPSVKIPGELSGGMKLQCYVVARKEGVIVIPPFSPFASGNDLNPGQDAVMAPALRTCDITQAEVYGISDLGLMEMGRLDDVSMLTL